MSLFQKSVEQKYLKQQDNQLVDKKYDEFQKIFGNPEKQKNIRNSTEPEYQSGFLNDLFVTILGYTLNPEPNYNLRREFKNVTDSKKADGAILKGDSAVGVIELKPTSITDLDSVENQAFGYKNHHPDCNYVITSNFERLRFYIQDAIDYVEFDLFNLTKERFSLLWLCLSKDTLLNDIPLKVKQSSVLEEKDVTERLYEDYSKFREEIFNDIVKNNPNIDKLTLFKKTQKLLDRFLFIFFAEDRLLLPPNSISEIINQWEEQTSWGDKVTLYDRFKKYFNLLNTGWKGKKYEIFPYNGGLFEDDPVLQNLIIDSDLLKNHTKKLSAYNFNPDNTDKQETEIVDVNILGHIFEHSLNEIEIVQAELKGKKVDQKKTKQKTEGIFYTPKYITKFIIENTIGRLCNEKRQELGIDEQEYAKGRKNRWHKTVKKLDKKLDDYREWLLSLAILDPACGSGAFLNEALDFLIKEHRKIDELHAQLFEDKLQLSEITKDILERNLYGVDLNDESIEIAKLSLWLRTAKKGRKLNKLSNNIKAGNSLIDDPNIAGESAFKWEKEFPNVLENGGFDVVIGNPPYVSANNMDYQERRFFNKFSDYKTLIKKWNLYIPFVERSLNLLKEDGFFSFIIPYGFLNQPYYKFR